MKKIGLILDKVTEVILIVFVALLFVIGVAQVFFRYVLGNSIPWSEELSRYIFVWLIFFGAALTTSKKSHIVIDIVLSYLPANSRKVVEFAGSIGAMIFFLFVVFEGVRLCEIAWSQLSPVLEIPMGFIYLAIPVGSFLMFFHTLRIILDRRAGQGGNR